MKRKNLLVMTVVGLMFSTAALADDIPVSVNQLPSSVKVFVRNNFKGKSIIYAEKDFKTYECRLSDGTKVEFTKKGDWKKVDSNDMTAVPSALVPTIIMKYVHCTFPGASITKIEKERYGYDIELSNDLELKFNRQGVLLRMDD